MSRRFLSRPRPDGQPRWLADLAGLAHDHLHAAGVRDIAAAGRCTVSEPSAFFSFRRDGLTGRMAAAVWRRA
jgi:polyphenol oxidase